MDASLIGISLYLLISLILFQITFNRKVSKRFLRKSDDLREIDWSFFKPDQAWLMRQNPKILKLKVRGSLRSAYFLDSYGKEAQTAIILHGYVSSAIKMALFARIYHDVFKMNTLLIDLSAHGLSEGSLIRFALGDYKDINLWVNHLNELGYTADKYCQGISMGGATILFALADHLHPDIKKVITDSAYTNLDPILKTQAMKLYKGPALLFMPGISFWMKVHLGFSLAQVNVYHTLKALDRPCLLIHGTNDFFVPYTQSEHFHEKFPTSTLKLFKNSGHACSVKDYRNDYIETLKAFINQ